MTLEERFWSHVDKTGECWEWKGSRGRGGYGRMRVGQNKWSIASRVAWKLTHGEIPDGLFVLHACDNPPCVRPDHLFLGTNADNMRDAAAKGRLSGWNRTRSDLTKSDIAALRRLYAMSSMTIADMARAYHMSPSTTAKLVKGATWDWLPGKQELVIPATTSNCKLTFDDVALIRAIWRTEDTRPMMTELAQRFGVDRSTISRVVHGQSW